MFSAIKSGFVALALLATASVLAAPLAPPTVELCTAANFAGGCVHIPVVSDSCINFVGGLSFLNDEISSAIVPGGFVCTMYMDAGCFNGGVRTEDAAILTDGSWPYFASIQGLNGAQNFNDQTSSMSCSPL